MSRLEEIEARVAAAREATADENPYTSDGAHLLVRTLARDAAWLLEEITRLSAPAQPVEWRRTSNELAAGPWSIWRSTDGKTLWLSFEDEEGECANVAKCKDADQGMSLAENLERVLREAK